MYRDSYYIVVIVVLITYVKKRNVEIKMKNVKNVTV